MLTSEVYGLVALMRCGGLAVSYVFNALPDLSYCLDGCAVSTTFLCAKCFPKNIKYTCGNKMS